MDTLDCMRMFVAVAAQKSFTGGARQLGVSVKLASKYVARLEEHLGAQLFHRTTRNVTLTDTGRAYLDRCIPLLDQIDEMEGVIQERQSELAGTIRVTAPTGLGSRELVEAISPFQKRHPKVQIEFLLSDSHTAIVEEGIDLAVRFGALKDSTLVARKLCEMRLVVVASKDYLERHGEPVEPEALATHNCLLLTTSHSSRWSFQDENGVKDIEVSGSFKANSPRAVAHMAANGVGITRCPYYVVGPFLETGQLKILFPDKEATKLPLYVVYPPSRHLTARIRALIEHLADWFQGADRSGMDGQEPVTSVTC